MKEAVYMVMCASAMGVDQQSEGEGEGEERYCLVCVALPQWRPPGGLLHEIHDGITRERREEE